jgi:hypothetical protein
MTTKDTKTNRQKVRFNVGGTHYDVSRDTVERCEGSMRASPISDRWKEGSTKSDDPIFIDRNGLLFQYVLDYLRNDKLLLPSSVSRAAVAQEFEYYGIDADVAKVSEKYGPMYLRELKERICEQKIYLELLENEARAIQASTFVENESFKHQLPVDIRIPTEFVPFDAETLRECSDLKGLIVTLVQSSGSSSSTSVTVKEKSR